MLVASTGFSQAAAPGRAMTTKSRAGMSAACLRKDSLTTRLIRLRCTADRDTFRETARPIRGEALVPGAAMIVKQASLRRRPVFNTREKSAGDSRRRVAGRPCGARGAACPRSPVVPADRASDSESSAPLGAPTGQHKAAILRGHAGAESVGPLASQIARLIRALHRTVSVRGVSVTTLQRLAKRREMLLAAPGGVNQARLGVVPPLACG